VGDRGRAGRLGPVRAAGLARCPLARHRDPLRDRFIGKFSAILGPVLFAAIGRLFGTSRYSIISLIVSSVAGMVLLSRVDEGEGIPVARAEDAAAA
jgi:hypothetical protein